MISSTKHALRFLRDEYRQAARELAQLPLHSELYRIKSEQMAYIEKQMKDYEQQIRRYR